MAARESGAGATPKIAATQADARTASPTGAEERDFVITRVFNAPRELMFRAWTEPRHMARWWGPHEFTNPVCDMDVRPGGAYRIVMRGADGTDYPITGVFREVVPPERLVLTMDCSEHPEAWHDLVQPNRRPDETNPAGVMLSTVTFEAVGAKTLLTVRMRLASPATRDAMLKMGMTEGWSQSLDRLEDLLAKI
jgi:uncharacterized protein YndB with AHSA1/START domain